MKTKIVKRINILNIIDVVISFCITLLLVIGFIYINISPSSFTPVSDEFYEQCCNVIIWETKYDETLEKNIIQGLHTLPESILNCWLKEDSKIVIVPNERGYLDVKTDYLLLSDKNDSRYTIAYNDIRSIDGDIYYSYIYVLGNEKYISHAVLHEIGHYVYYQYFGINSDYVLPNYEDDHEKYILNDGDCNNYYSGADEYFAEIFAYTITHGTDDFYKDTFVMQKIIEDF